MSQETDLTSRGPQAPLPDGMEYCQITGALTPTSDIVELHGYRVCAEGKMEILRRLRAGLAMPGEMETSRIRARSVALFIDCAILEAIIVAGALIVGFNPYTEKFGEQIPGASAQASLESFHFQCFFYIVLTLLCIGYYGWFHATSGQTPGKMAARIMVVDLDGKIASWKKVAARTMVVEGPSLVGFIYLLSITDVEITTFSADFFLLLEVAWLGADTLVALLDRAKQRSIHDRLSGTRVIAKR
ncbi:MAG: RDD family protein [Nitrospinota bacterium]|nr:RDD family protein [Nitrospinota bacterium]